MRVGIETEFGCEYWRIAHACKLPSSGGQSQGGE